MKKILFTGTAGFIGSKVSEMLLEDGYDVIGVDNLNDYYDIRLKSWRLDNLNKYDNFIFYKNDIENPFIYLSTNAVGYLNLLKLSKEYNINKFILTSTSSLYAGQEVPFREGLPVNAPISPYAASKKAAEAIAYTYHYLYGLDVTILRYFTVYGPAGRSDMALSDLLNGSWKEYLWKSMEMVIKLETLPILMILPKGQLGH